MPITREEWDSLEIGDVLILQERVTGTARFEVAHVDSYTAPSRWTDSGVLINNDRPTVIEVANSKDRKLRFNNYLCENPLSRVVKSDRTI